MCIYTPRRKTKLNQSLFSTKGDVGPYLMTEKSVLKSWMKISLQSSSSKQMLYDFTQARFCRQTHRWEDNPDPYSSSHTNPPFITRRGTIHWSHGSVRTSVFKSRFGMSFGTEIFLILFDLLNGIKQMPYTHEKHENFYIIEDKNTIKSWTRRDTRLVLCDNQ